MDQRIKVPGVQKSGNRDYYPLGLSQTPILWQSRIISSQRSFSGAPPIAMKATPSAANTSVAGKQI